jgi:thymidine kinase
LKINNNHAGAREKMNKDFKTKPFGMSKDLMSCSQSVCSSFGMYCTFGENGIDSLYEDT